MLASQRRPLLGDDWRASAELERRMLLVLDAFASLGSGALPHVEAFVLDSPTADPIRLYAAGFLLGAVAGRDALGLAERLVRATEDDAALGQFADALVTAPHPHSNAMLSSWLGDSDPAFRAAALRVLVARNAATPSQLRAALDDRAEVAVYALLPLQQAKDPVAAERCRYALESTYLPLRRIAWIVLAMQSRRQARDILVAELGGDFAHEAAPLLAVVGGREQARQLLSHASDALTPQLLQALGVTGSIDVVGPLLDLLAHPDEDVGLASAAALERITGAQLRREVMVAPQKLDDVDLPDAKTGGFAGPPSLAAQVSEPRFVPEEGSPDTLELPPPDVALWRAWWDDNRAHFDTAVRYRMGKPCSTSVIWMELAGSALSYTQRAQASTELTMLLGSDAGFSVDQFVALQLLALERWRPLAERRASTPGQWPT